MAEVQLLHDSIIISVVGPKEEKYKFEIKVDSFEDANHDTCYYLDIKGFTDGNAAYVIDDFIGEKPEGEGFWDVMKKYDCVEDHYSTYFYRSAHAEASIRELYEVFKEQFESITYQTIDDIINGHGSFDWKELIT